MKQKSHDELRGGIIPLLASLAIGFIPTAIEMGMAADQAKRQEASQRALDEYFRKQDEAVRRDIEIEENLRRAQQETKERFQMGIAEQREASMSKNIQAQQQLLEGRKQRAEAERLRQTQEREALVREQSLKSASERQRIFQAEQEAQARKMEGQRVALEQRNAAVRTEMDQLAQNRMRDAQQRQSQMSEVLRLQQEAINRDVQQRLQMAQATATAPPPRVVQKARTALTLRRGRGADNEVLTYLTSTMGLSMKDAKKVLKSYF